MALFNRLGLELAQSASKRQENIIIGVFEEAGGQINCIQNSLFDNLQNLIIY